MKKSVFTLLTLVFMSFGNVTTANAQQVITASQDYNYNQVRKNVLDGDEDYRRGAWNSAIVEYQWALRDNGSCTGRKYISDEEISRKIDDCEFALHHNGQRREDYNQKQRDDATANFISALVDVLTKK